MKDKIVNKVAQSALVTFDLEELYPKGVLLEVDLSQWLDQGFILREKEFRAAIKNHDWNQYRGNYIAMNCKTDAILPAWASLLVTAQLSQVANQIVWGYIKDLEKHLFSQAITNLDLTPFKGKPIIVKGCSDKEVPEDAFVQLIQKLQPVAKSLFYGEACSSVPLFKS